MSTVNANVRAHIRTKYGDATLLGSLFNGPHYSGAAYDGWIHRFKLSDGRTVFAWGHAQVQRACRDVVMSDEAPNESDAYRLVTGRYP